MYQAVPRSHSRSSSEKNLTKQLAEKYSDCSTAIIDLVDKEGLQAVTQANVSKAMSTTVQGVTKFRSALTTAGGVVKSFVGTLGNMAIAMAASWAIGKGIEGLDYLFHYKDNIIKAGEEAKESIDNTFQSFSDGKQKIMDLGSSFADQTDSIKVTGDAIDQIADKYAELKSDVNQNTNENISLY